MPQGSFTHQEVPQGQFLLIEMLRIENVTEGTVKVIVIAVEFAMRVD